MTLVTVPSPIGYFKVTFVNLKIGINVPNSILLGMMVSLPVLKRHSLERKLLTKLKFVPTVDFHAHQISFLHLGR